MRLLAIDPGNTESAYVIIDADRRPVEFDKIDNFALLGWLGRTRLQELGFDHAVIEMVSSFGMPVGLEVFHTVRWIGRFQQCLADWPQVDADLIFRKPIKRHFCGTDRAKDPNVTQALVDRFAPGQRNHGKGTKAEPGWFYGFHRDIWQAYALAVYAADRAEGLAA